ncbi:MAG: Ser-Thr-rich GPI-anchored membrane family protein [Patescibacteria group bacterium]
MFKKIFIAFVLVSILAPLTTNAQNIADLEQKIGELSARVKVFQNQGAIPVKRCQNFEVNLGVGSSGVDVLKLHAVLKDEGFSVGESDKFDERTAVAVSKLQSKYEEEILTPSGLTAPTGYFGSATRRKINSLFDCSGQQNPIVISPPPINLLPKQPYPGNQNPIILRPSPTDPTPKQPSPANPNNQSLTVISPDGGESWQKGAYQVISWSDREYHPVNDSVVFKVFIQNYPAKYTYTIAEVHNQSDLSLQWKVGTHSYGNLEPGAYQITVDKYVNGKYVVSDSSDSFFKIYDSTRPITPIIPEDGIDLAVTSFTMDADGPKAVLCNLGSKSIPTFPGEVAVNGMSVLFPNIVYHADNPGACLTHQWPGYSWPADDGTYRASIVVDPDNIYQESNESNNKLTTNYSGTTTVAVVTRFYLLSPNGRDILNNGTNQAVRWDGSAFSRDGKVKIVLDNNIGYRAEFWSSNDGFEMIPINVPSADVAKVTQDDDVGGRFALYIYGVDVNPTVHHYYDNEGFGYDYYDQLHPNHVVFIKDSSNRNGRSPSISGVSGPTTLKVNERGTWRVEASDSENGNLSYSVRWGDEVSTMRGGVAIPSYVPTQQTASFTHRYAKAGTYTPTFTVTDNSGQSAQTSLSVRVGNFTAPYIPISPQPLTVLSPNGGEIIRAGDTYNIRWSASNLTYGARLEIGLFRMLNIDDEGQTFDRYIAENSTVSGNTTYSWSVPKDLPTGQYKILIIVHQQSGAKLVSDYSDRRFTVINSFQPVLPQAIPGTIQYHPAGPVQAR